MTDLTLSIDGSRTVDAKNLTTLNSALKTLTQAHEANNPVAVQSGSLRWRDEGVWIHVTLSLPTTPDNITADKDTLAQVAVDTGLMPDMQTATEEINVA